jgi:hypothetical protein
MKPIECTKCVSLGISKLDEISKDFMDNTHQLLFCSTVITALPFLCTASTYRILYQAAQSNSFWFTPHDWANFNQAHQQHVNNDLTVRKLTEEKDKIAYFRLILRK